MLLRTFLLLITLLSLLGLCTVHEAMKQTRMRYRMAETLAEEERLRQELVVLKAEVASLANPTRLEQLARDTDPDLVPLLPMPELEETADRVASRPR
jgi:cell division protein FtsL